MMKTTLFSFDEWFTIFEELLVCDYFESLAYCDMRFDISLSIALNSM